MNSTYKCNIPKRRETILRTTTFIPRQCNTIYTKAYKHTYTRLYTLRTRVLHARSVLARRVRQIGGYLQTNDMNV